MIIDERWNDCDRNTLFRLVDNSRSFLVFHAHHILSVHLQQLMIDKQTVSGSRRILDDGRDFSIIKLESNVAIWILVHGDRTLKRTITNHNGNIIFWALTE